MSRADAAMAPPNRAPTRDLASSNSTANAFLGGRSLPSWITGGAPSPHLPQKDRPPRLPPPQVLTPPVRMQSSTPNNLLPSPAPSEDRPIIVDLAADDHDSESERRRTHKRRRTDASAPASFVAAPIPRPPTRINTSVSQSLPPNQPAPDPQAQCHSPEYCNARLQDLMRHFPINTLGHLERTRLGLIQEAVHTNDYVYLTFHQFMCLHSVDPERLPLEIKHLRGASEAFDLLYTLLMSNSELRPEVVVYFTIFPASLTDMRMKWPNLLANEIERFKLFVIRSQHGWTRLQQECKQRGWPPMVQELILYLGIDSPLLQQTVYRAIVRRLWLPSHLDGAAASRLFWRESEGLFAKHQQRFNQVILSRGSPMPSERQSAQEAQQYSTFFIHIYNKFLELLHNSAPRAIPVVPLTSNVDQQTMYPRRIPPTGFATTGQQMQMNQMAFARNAVPHYHHHHHVNRGMMPFAGSSSSVPPSTMGLARPPTNAVLQSMPRQMNGELQQRRQTMPAQGSSSLFIPPAGYTALQAAQPDPTRVALHQAHLRSPKLRAMLSKEEPAIIDKFYRFVVGFSLEPTKLPENSPQTRMAFTISAEQYASLPIGEISESGPLFSRTIFETSKMYRLRCVKTNTPLDEQQWAVKDTVWPRGVFLRFNNHPLEARKKLHYGKDLPIDLTSYIQEGQNVLEINNLRMPEAESISNFTMAIEVVGFQRHDTIKAECLADRQIPSEEVQASIKASLNSPDDDEIAVVNDNISIGLFDPFSGCRIFNIPVRGRSCVHRDCFDLETYLETRAFPRKEPAAPSAVDTWKCPLCNADARPKSLVVDGFLVEVRAKLAEQGLLDTRAIIVEPDGSWRPKPEKDKDKEKSLESRPDTPVLSGGNVERRSSSRAAVSAGPTVTPQVIDLDSD
ncbi:uncharacterized protein K452DRAFT_360256 [Aplosporella prunicola CBS 121167]|uniref:SP-RING-type domain-containing protein n=1 Tax=Aplosporella prunicola CBS 121167 TaxID=1176127 RepID=A0A6A6B823_9PEZI|nr:uncharacterized protein K452DRAFT_360256 [Aplosporella prunicola CBS 121167]KAF2140066.1 hypothetical protein K452DRAFT_360256 [Aplosporella prunicola CBS 121167]